MRKDICIEEEYPDTYLEEYSVLKKELQKKEYL